MLENTKMFAMSVTPFDGAGQLDEAALRTHLRFLKKAKIGVYLGSFGTGEGRMLSRDEIRKMYQIGVEELSGEVPVIAAALGLNATDLVIEMAEEAHAIGVDAVQIHPPMGGAITVPPTPEEMYNFYNTVLTAVTGPVVLSNEVLMVAYSVPVGMMVEMVKSYRQVQAVNWTDLNPGSLVDLMAQIKDAVPVYVGLVAQLPLALSLGACGAVTFESNFAPRLCADVPRAFNEGDLPGMTSALCKILGLNIVLAGKYMTPRSTKAALAYLGSDGMRMRAPFNDLSEEEVNEIGRLIDKAGIPEYEGW